MHNPDMESSNEMVSVLELIDGNKTASNKQKAQWAGFTEKQYSRLIKGESPVEIDHIEGLMKIMTKLILQEGDIGEISNVSYQLLCNMLPRAMRELILEKHKVDLKERTNNIKKTMANKRADNFKKSIDDEEKVISEPELKKVMRYAFVCENGTELELVHRMDNEGVLYFRGRLSVDGAEEAIYGSDELVKILHSGGLIRAFNRDLGIPPSLYRVKSRCRKAESKIKHLVQELADGTTEILI